MAPPSPLAIATSSLQRLVKEEASYYKELEKQEARLKKVEASTEEDENREYTLKQEVSPPNSIHLPPAFPFHSLSCCSWQNLEWLHVRQHSSVLMAQRFREQLLRRPKPYSQRSSSALRTTSRNFVIRLRRLRRATPRRRFRRRL